MTAGRWSTPTIRQARHPVPPAGRDGGPRPWRIRRGWRPNAVGPENRGTTRTQADDVGALRLPETRDVRRRRCRGGTWCASTFFSPPRRTARGASSTSIESVLDPATVNSSPEAPTIRPGARQTVCRESTRVRAQVGRRRRRSSTSWWWSGRQDFRVNDGGGRSSTR